MAEREQGRAGDPLRKDEGQMLKGSSILDPAALILCTRQLLSPIRMIPKLVFTQKAFIRMPLDRTYGAHPKSCTGLRALYLLTS